MMAISIASLVAFAIAGACLLILRKLTLRRVAVEDLNSWVDFASHTAHPLERLLDPAEFEHLRGRGISRERIRALRARRRYLFRMYMRRLTEEFNTAHEALQGVLLRAGCDRPDLARELSRQRLLFYRGLVAVELRLELNALGFEATPSLELLRPLERMHLEFCRLVPAAAA
jgi:hypothetical protein